MALGSSRVLLAHLVLRQGVSIGIVTGLLYVRFLRGFLYKIPTNDPLTFAIVPALLIRAVHARALTPGPHAAATCP